MLSATNTNRSIIEPIAKPSSIATAPSTQPIGPTYSAPDYSAPTVSGASDASGGSATLYRLIPSDSTRNPVEVTSFPTLSLDGGTPQQPVTQQPATTPQANPLAAPSFEPIDFSSITDPYGGNVSAPTAGDTAQTSMLSSVLASLGSLFGSGGSASGGTGADSPGSVTAVPVSAPQPTTTGNTTVKNLLLLAIVVGVAYYGYKKGWFKKLGIGASAAQ